jgi:hypothetical protein
LRLDIKTLRLSFDGAEAHGQAWQEQDTREDTADKATFHKFTLPFIQGNAVQIDLHNGGEKGIDSGPHAH